MSHIGITKDLRLRKREKKFKGNRKSRENRFSLNIKALEIPYSSVLVPSGCCNKLPHTGWFINSRNFSQLWRLANPRSSNPQIWLPLRTHFLVHSHCLLIVSSHGRRADLALWCLIYKGSNPIHEASTFLTE